MRGGSPGGFVKVISIGMFLKGNQPVAWRGPMLHRALEQFILDVHFGALDILLLDLPPGTGDIAISMSQLLPTPSWCWSPPRSMRRLMLPSAPAP